VLSKRLNPAQRSNADAKEKPSHEEIEQRAYTIYLERGGCHGHDFDDWLQAERGLNEGNALNRHTKDRKG